jgi:hypothetical protein
MRKLIVCNIMSLDGYYTGPDNNVMALPMDESFDAYNAERLRAADTLLLGRTSYEGFKGFWSPVADDPAPQWTPTHREISRLENAIDKIVISDSLTSDQAGLCTCLLRKRQPHLHRVGPSCTGADRKYCPWAHSCRPTARIAFHSPRFTPTCHSQRT